MGPFVPTFDCDEILVARSQEQGDRKIKKKVPNIPWSIGVEWMFHIEEWLESGWSEVGASVWRALGVRYGGLRLYQAGFREKWDTKAFAKIPHSGRVKKGNSRCCISVLLGVHHLGTCSLTHHFLFFLFLSYHQLDNVW